MHAIFVLGAGVLFSKLEDGAPPGGLLLVNEFAIVSGIIYGMWIMRLTYKDMIKEYLDDKNEK